MALVSCSSASSFPRNRRPRFTHDNDENRLLWRQSKQSTTKMGWQWPSTPADYGKQSTIYQIAGTVWIMRDTNICMRYHRSCSTRGAIDAQSFACQPDTTNQTNGMQFRSQQTSRYRTRFWLAPCPLIQNEIRWSWSIRYLQTLVNRRFDRHEEWHL